jgi:hypothetical protein
MRCLAVLLLASLAAQVDTPRKSPVVLPLPKGDDVFHFVVFGDRTSGVPAGLVHLEQAVADTNLLDPDLVMTVGDLVQGYNDDATWLAQMREYKAIMARLRMPWYPVPGNHDVYPASKDSKDRPRGHEDDYERHFGPLWYAFPHKRCWFVVLYSDEGDPATGKKALDEPASQRMSQEQFAWLQQVLGKAKGAEHVFLFLHHPRWHGGGYGDDWAKVHALLKEAGNVRAVFAGHIHRMRYDGKRDGIEYFTLAATGASLEHDAPRGGFLHEFHVVTVRKEGIALATIPVGAVMDPRSITGEVSIAVDAVCSDLAPGFPVLPPLGDELDVNGKLAVEIANPSKLPIEVTVTPEGDDPRWRYVPDHLHATIAGGARATIELRVSRPRSPFDEWFATPELLVDVDVLAPAQRVTLPQRRFWIPFRPPDSLIFAETQSALALDGRSCARVDDAALSLPDGPLTVEGWLQGRSFQGRRAFVAKTENSEFGIFVSDGVPEFLLHLGDRYATAKPAESLLRAEQWHHVAGVFDGQELRLYVDGRQIAAQKASGARKRNALPFYVGADPRSNGRPNSYFSGRLDEIRVSRGARYREPFVPARRLATDDETVLLLHMDRLFGAFVPDASARRAHALCLGKPELAPVDLR